MVSSIASSKLITANERINLRVHKSSFTCSQCQHKCRPAVRSNESDRCVAVGWKICWLSGHAHRHTATEKITKVISKLWDKRTERLSLQGAYVLWSTIVLSLCETSVMHLFYLVSVCILCAQTRKSCYNCTLIVFLGIQREREWERNNYYNKKSGKIK